MQCILALAQYDANAPPALPAVGIINLSIPSSFALDTAALIPLALKDPVGLRDSSFMSIVEILFSAANFSREIIGVPPSPSEIISFSSTIGNSEL